MKKSFTLFLMVLCMALSSTLLAQEAKLFRQGKPSEQKEKLQPASSEQAPVFSKSDLLTSGYSEDVLEKNFTKVTEELYQPITMDDKLKEINMAIRSRNQESSAADVVLRSLPKIKKADSFDATVGSYHSELEELFFAHPSLLENLGPAFTKAFNSPEAFKETVKIALDKGHSN